MNKDILTLQPSALWFYFNEICKIPRPSKQEEKIAEYICNFGQQYQLETFKDKTGNVFICKPATPGMEKKKTVILQSHMDMVCEKNSDTSHDFLVDPIIPWIDGDWVKAKGTTLGADDGIGIATQLAILAADNIEHGSLECIFTVDEETGLTGAFGLEPESIKGKILLNLDSEDEGELFIGCAGGVDTVANLPYLKTPVPENVKAFQIKVSGLTGGHSGDDINKGRANAIKLLTRILQPSMTEYGARLAGFDGGNLRNAIPREAFAKVVVADVDVESFMKLVADVAKQLKNEFRVNEPELTVTLIPTEMPEFLIDKATQTKLIQVLYACPHGVIAMSADIPNFVETSTNLASVKMHEESIEITSSQRSSVDSAKAYVMLMVENAFLLADAKVKHSDGYPGWAPNANSEILEITRKAYFDLFNQQPKVLAIHAGLECGLVGEKVPGMDMISFGPTLKGVHSPDEKLHIPSVTRFWDLTVEVLKRIPEDEN